MGYGWEEGENEVPLCVKGIGEEGENEGEGESERGEVSVSISGGDLGGEGGEMRLIYGIEELLAWFCFISKRDRIQPFSIWEREKAFLSPVFSFNTLLFPRCCRLYKKKKVWEKKNWVDESENANKTKWKNNTKEIMYKQN